MRRDGHQRRPGIAAVAGLDLVDVAKIGRRLEGGIELELPAVTAHIAVGFDFVALPVERAATVVIRRDVDV